MIATKAAGVLCATRQIDNIGAYSAVELVFQIASLAISIWALVELGFLGTPGMNRYGPDPLAPKKVRPGAR